MVCAGSGPGVGGYYAVAERLEAFAPQAQRYLGEIKRGPVWDRLLREYCSERVFVGIAVERVVSWLDLWCSGDPHVAGAGWPAPQQPPKNGPAPCRGGRAAGRIAVLSHRVLAYRGGDGFPVVVPVQLGGHDATGLRLVAAPGQSRIRSASAADRQ